MSTFNYWGFGLHITSEIPFPELFPASFSEQSDVSIRLGEISDIPVGHSFSTGRITYVMNDREMLFTVKDIATYYISGGNTVVISADNDGIEKHVLRLFVLAGALAAVLQQRRTIPMHAAAIIKDGKLVFISGHSGAGKSTTLAGLMAKQYQVFSDDVTVLAKGENTLMHGIASYPMIKLWEQSMQTLDYAAFSDRSFPIMPGMEKYGVFFHEHFDTKQYPVTKIILLKLSEDDLFTTEELTGGNAFAAVMQHIYKPSFFNTQDMRMLKFSMITQLLQHTTVYQIARPPGCEPDELLSHVTALI
jgi:energy-coupling factor transporter ATP-binding protein EcfA2